MIPRTLAAWTIRAICDLIDAQVYEADTFDFKSQLPDRRDEQGKQRLRESSVAFANSSGGFLVFGIADDRSLPSSERLRGVPATTDFPKLFGDLLEQCTPSIDFTPMNPPLTLTSSHVVPVIWIPESQRKPHGLLDGRRWVFTKRTNRSDEPMSYEEVRMAFEGTEFRRTKLALLVSELDVIKATAAAVVRPVEQSSSQLDRVQNWSWMTRYSTTVLDSVLGDAMSVLGANDTLWKDLSAIRASIRRSNLLSEQLAITVSMKSMGSLDNYQRLDWQRDIHEQAVKITERCTSAQQIIATWLQSVAASRNARDGDGQ